ncbi:hypothetical protein MGYG_07807 [Nannizzia gypsea CBS 118893]|uniref:Uncharacterized protein n=1 Tax=Arthroderma gypseum (strain ATCC MYA-4604 / CBS 118893) TaxID=535722 RepID=E4V476_ARTGP|nr:hypothetical protein MGYG_07807 [Nannizzia gypsea CBS 118893]EFR04800.1 hypothetical protein MGYG_07807 [Nannizzia gypsea CBS 118893]
MRLSNSPVYILAACSLLSTAVFAADHAQPEALPTRGKGVRSNNEHDYSAPEPSAVIEKRAIVDAPADPVPTVPIQVSPVTMVWVDGVQVPYTQTFPPFPDPWPSPKPGQIGLGNIQGEVGKTTTIKARSLPTDEPELEPVFARQCRTLECGKSREQKAERAEDENNA